MADTGLFIGWGAPVRGREKKGLDVFNEAVQWYGQVQQDGRIESFEVALLDPHGGDPGGAFSYGTAIGYVPLREWIAEHHGVDPGRVLVTNGSMQADAFLFETLVQAGDAVITERPTYDRTLLSLRGRAAEVHMVELEEDGIDVEALAGDLSG